MEPVIILRTGPFIACDERFLRSLRSRFVRNWGTRERDEAPPHIFRADQRRLSAAKANRRLRPADDAGHAQAEVIHFPSRLVEARHGRGSGGGRHSVLAPVVPVDPRVDMGYQGAGLRPPSGGLASPERLTPDLSAEEDELFLDSPPHDLKTCKPQAGRTRDGA